MLPPYLYFARPATRVENEALDFPGRQALLGGGGVKGLCKGFGHWSARRGAWTTLLFQSHHRMGVQAAARPRLAAPDDLESDGAPKELGQAPLG